MTTVARPRYVLEVEGPGGRKRVEIDATPFAIGREAGNDLALDDPRASRRHAVLEVVPDGRMVVRDLGSSNGTVVEDRRLTGGSWLSPSATMKIGQTSIAVRTDYVRRDRGRALGQAGRDADLAARLADAGAITTAVVALAVGLLDLAVAAPAVGRGGPGFLLFVLGVTGLAAGTSLLASAFRAGPRPSPEAVRQLAIVAVGPAAIGIVQIAWHVLNQAPAGLWLPLAELVLAGTTIGLALAAGQTRTTE